MTFRIERLEEQMIRIERLEEQMIRKDDFLTLLEDKATRRIMFFSCSTCFTLAAFLSFDPILTVAFVILGGLFFGCALAVRNPK